MIPSSYFLKYKGNVFGRIRVCSCAILLASSCGLTSLRDKKMHVCRVILLSFRSQVHIAGYQPEYVQKLAFQRFSKNDSKNKIQERLQTSVYLAPLHNKTPLMYLFPRNDFVSQFASLVMEN